MAIGDISNPKRPEYQANERFDTADAEVGSQASRNYLDAATRGLLSSNRAAGGSGPTGLLTQGFGLTLNPRNPTHGLAQVTSPLRAALAAHGRRVHNAGCTTTNTTPPTRHV